MVCSLLVIAGQRDGRREKSTARFHGEASPWPTTDEAYSFSLPRIFVVMLGGDIIARQSGFQRQIPSVVPRTEERGRHRYCA